MYKDDDYKMRKDTVYFKEDIDFMKRAEKKKEEYGLEKERVRERVLHEAIPRMDSEIIQKLKLKSAQVIGSIFDRVKFLELRITEIRESLQLRKTLHDDMIKNIDKDVQDKENMLSFVSDQGEKRNLKLDISLLRREKRHEQVQFWKDTTELMTELREFTEQFETEKKITSIFGDINVE